MPILIFTLSACKKELDYSIYVSDLRENVYLSDDGTVSATFGFRETPFFNDGKVMERHSRLVIKLQNEDYDGDYKAKSAYFAVRDLWRAKD